MLLLLTLSFGILIILSYTVFEKRHNVISLTIIIWYMSAFLLKLNLMSIDPVRLKTYAIITTAILFIIIGAFVGSMTYFPIKTKSFNGRKKNNDNLLSIRFYYELLIVSGSVIIYNTIILLTKYGGITIFLANANKLYAERISGDYVLTIPYLGSLAFVSCSLGGYHLSKHKKNFKNILLYFLLPIFLIIIDSATILGRADIIISFFLFFSSYLYSNYKTKNYQIKIINKQLFYFMVINVVLWSLLIQFRDIRGGYENYHFKKKIPAIEFLEQKDLFRPSMYLYFVSPIAVFDNTIGHNFNDRTWFPGKETFAPIIRLLGKPFNIEVERYEASVSIGIREANTGTMLKDFYMDFGILGMLIMCLILGFIFYRTTKKWYKNDTFVIELSFLSTYFLMSIFVNLFRLGQFMIPLLLILVLRKIFKYKWKLR